MHADRTLRGFAQLSLALVPEVPALPRTAAPLLTLGLLAVTAIRRWRSVQ